MGLSATQIGILKDVAANKVSLDDAGQWLRDQLVEIVMLDGPPLIDTLGSAVFLTEDGTRALKETVVK